MSSLLVNVTLVGVISLLPSAIKSQILCFKSIQAFDSKPIRLQMELPEDHSKVGSIKYEHNGKSVIIVRSEEKAASSKDVLPAVIRSEFREIDNGNSSGTYVMTSQGAMVGELSYMGAKDKTAIIFMDDQESHSDTGCQWERKAH